MKLLKMKEEIQKYIYLEDTGVIDVSIASVLANQLKLDSNVWLAIVGESSGGKSQILKPIMNSNPEYFIKIDDLTENTFLSGAAGGKHSLLNESRVDNMMVISDLTVLFSKNKEARNAILGQFRTIFDGILTKFIGTRTEPLTWKGRMGVLAGCTPSIYRYFEEVSDMGERFIFYRLRPNDSYKATQLAMNRKFSGREIDDNMTELYQNYIKEVAQSMSDRKDEIVLTDIIKERIIEVSMFAELLRTSVATDKFTGEIESLPSTAMPMRTALQIKAVVKGMVAINVYEGDEVVDILKAIDWLGFSLANEEIRKSLEVMYSIPFGETMTKAEVADEIGLGTKASGNILQRLAAVGVLERISGEGSHKFKIANERYYKLLKRLFGEVDSDPSKIAF